MVEVFRLVWQVLRDDGTVWLNLGDSYAGSGKGQYEEGSKDPKREKIRGMKLPRSGYSDGRKNREERLRNGSIESLKYKDLIGMPWRVAFALQQDGWYLRQDIIWAKPNPMPESINDRCTKAHEYIFLLSKSGKTQLWRAKDTLEWSYSPDLSETVVINGEEVKRWRGFCYYYDQEPIKEPHIWGGVKSSYRVGEASKNGGSPQDPIIGKGNTTGSFRAFGEGGRNRRSVWSVSTKPFKEAHFAVFPPELIEPCILAGAPKGGVVLDPFLGAGTTTMVAKQLGRIGLGIELNHEYCEMSRERLRTALHPKNANPRHPAPEQSKLTCFCE